MADYTVAGVCYNKYEMALAKKVMDTINEGVNGKTIDCVWYMGNENNPDPNTFRQVQGRVRDWTKEHFHVEDVLIFICPAVRAVRYIGHLLEDQMTDPAVLAIDARGKCCVPLLSGRRGEAYEIARILDSKLGIEFINPVVSDDPTQLDIMKYAEAYDMVLSNTDYAKEVNAAIGAGDGVGFYTSYPVLGNLPEGIQWKSEGALGIYISPSYHNAFFDHTLWLIPKCLVIGIECEPDVPYARLSRFIENILKDYSLYPEAILKMAICNTSEGYPAIRALCYEKDVQVVSYSEEQLAQIKGLQGEELALCESAALKASEDKLLISCVSGEGIRCAIAMKSIYVEF